MDILINPGGSPGMWRAGEDLAAGKFFKISTTELNSVVECGAGENAQGFTLEAIPEGEILNKSGIRAVWRMTTGIISGVTLGGEVTLGAEIMSDADGDIVAYANSADNRALGRLIETEDDDGTPTILLYAM